MVHVGFIGAGRMGQALIRGFISKGLLRSEDITAFDVDTSKLQDLQVKTEYSAFETVERSDVILLCVKPKDVDHVLEEIKGIAGTRLFISIVAGLSCEKIESVLQEARVVRVMPNTPALIYQMAGAFSLGVRATPEDGEFVAKLLTGLGLAYELDESLMDAITGLSGSGPAYVYYMIAALVEAGIRQGLADDVAVNLVLQTIRGAVDMVAVSKRHPDDLIDDVRSPDGTTMEGLRVLDEAGVDIAIINAVDAATKKSKVLGAPPELREKMMEELFRKEDKPIEKVFVSEATKQQRKDDVLRKEASKIIDKRLKPMDESNKRETKKELKTSAPKVAVKKPETKKITVPKKKEPKEVVGDVHVMASKNVAVVKVQVPKMKAPQVGKAIYKTPVLKKLAVVKTQVPKKAVAVKMNAHKRGKPAPKKKPVQSKAPKSGNPAVKKAVAVQSKAPKRGNPAVKKAVAVQSKAPKRGNPAVKKAVLSKASKKGKTAPKKKVAKKTAKKEMTQAPKVLRQSGVKKRL